MRRNALVTRIAGLLREQERRARAAFPAVDVNAISSDRSICVAYSRKTVSVIVTAIIASACIAAAFVTHVAETQDANASEQVRHFIKVMLDERQKTLSRYLVDYADWGQAYTHLHLTTDIDWAYTQDNFGRNIATDLGVDYLAVVAPSGKQTYAMVRGELTGGTALPLSGGFGALIEKARRLAPRQVAQAVLSIDGEPVLAAAAIMSTGHDGSTNISNSPPSVLFFGDRLTESELAHLRDPLKLDFLALPAVDAKARDVFLRTDDGSNAFALAISAPVPGREMLAALLPWLVLTSVLFGSLLLTLARQGVRVADLAREANTALAASNLLLEQEAHVDVVTGLPNRAMFLRCLREILAREAESAHLLFLDLDRFKPVNDRYGHAAGDAVLNEVGSRLKLCVSGRDVAARLGGDEFAILSFSRSESDVENLCVSILRSISTKMSYAGATFSVGVSIGIARIEPGCDSVEASMRRADAALYEAKRAGRMTYRFQTSILEREVA